jgi:signal transduction histidine kinase
MIPELLTRHLGDSGKMDFDAEIVAGQAPAQLIYPATPSAHGRIGGTADASVTLLDGMDGPGSGRGGPGGPPPDNGFRDAPPARGFRGSPPARFMPRPLLSGPAWTLLVRHKAGSLEALVERARVRNLAISGGLLLLIVATVAMLVRFSRQAQRLAELQMSFVAGVSHELRTPLTVIRTAAFNLRGKLAQQPGQVERYGTLIQDESQKLTALVEQVLEFAEAKAGAAMRQREPVAVAELIEQSLQSSQALTEKTGVVLEKQIAPGLPCILADEMAMRHALQNLIDNALKYGAAGSHWVGISARAVGDGAAQAVEITVADRGRGIPRDEQKHIFDPFFRGRNAVADQIHGTGLGLDIVRKIIEAHGGSIRVRSTPGQITEFTVRIPAAPAPVAPPSAKGA